MVIHRIKGMSEKAHQPLSLLRPAALFILNNLGKDLVGVEIGVFKGENAFEMLRSMPIKMLYLVDRYIFDETYKLSYIKDMVPVKAEALSRLEKFKERIKWLFIDSLEAPSEIPDELDFVYIDGNHTYPYVKADIENFWPKIKKGGVLAGHDYSKLKGKVGVKKAVKEFVMNNDLHLLLGKSDWWIVKK